MNLKILIVDFTDNSLNIIIFNGQVEEIFIQMTIIILNKFELIYDDE